MAVTRPSAHVFKEESPEVMNRSLGLDEARRSGMNWVVKTWVEVTLTEYALFQASRIPSAPGLDFIMGSKAPPIHH